MLQAQLTWLLYSAPLLVRRRALMTGMCASNVHYSCPTCESPLLPLPDNPKSLRCQNNHITDIAKEGYSYLMGPKKKNAAKEVLSDARTRAERAFFETGGFAAQADAVAEEVLRALELCPSVLDGEAPHVLNAGCGEGLFLRQLAKRSNRKLFLWGTDSNKLAVRYASKRQRDAMYAVAPPTKLPFPDGSFSVVFSAFAPSPWEEFCRVLKPCGCVIVARAGNRHLHQLRSELIEASNVPGAEEPKQFSAGLAERYARVCTEESYGEEMARQLLAMTAWGEEEAKEALIERRFGGGRSSSDGPMLTATVDMIMSTHRVWLGTGGEPI
jgi:23S rRNA (guanine745-N1)-methyltransferase